ncbi:MAG TPA: site-specific integrase [Telluria sp.]|jgi:integrase
MGGTGGIELRESSIRVRFTYRGRSCKETLYLNDEPMQPTPANAKYATRIAAEIRRKIVEGTFSYQDYFPHSPRANEAGKCVPMLFDVMDKWIRLHEIKASTKDQYRRRLENFWKKKLTNKPIAEVGYSDILEALKAGTWKSGKSRNNELSLIKGVFEFAKRDKLITENPCEEVARAGYQRPGPDPFDLAEAHQILDHLRAHRDEQILNFVQLMFFSGLRTSEGIALKWGDIDFQKKEMLIDGANVYDEEADSTKTYEARVVKLTKLAMEALQRQKVYTQLVGARVEGGGHVFHDPKTSKPWGYAKITDVRSFWEITLKQLGIRYRRPYNMRHTFATIGLMSGAKPGYLAKQLGHSLRMFFTVYAKWISSDDDDREMEKMEAALAKNSLDIPGARNVKE